MGRPLASRVAVGWGGGRGLWWGRLCFQEGTLRRVLKDFALQFSLRRGPGLGKGGMGGTNWVASEVSEKVS